MTLKLDKLIAVSALLLIATIGQSQTCDYTISPSTHHNWVDISAQYITDSIGLGFDTMIVRHSKKINVSSKDYNGKQSLVTRSYLKWDQAFDDQNSCTISSAFLTLKFTGNNADSHKTTSGSNNFIISRLTEEWGDDTLRWKTPGIKDNYRMPISSSTDAITVSGTTVGDEDYKINITSFLNYWRSNPNDNFGIEIRLADESGTRSLNFASSEFVSLLGHPKIEIVFSNCTKNKAFAGNDTEICIGDSYELQANYLEFFEWSSTAPINDKFIRNPETKPVVPGTYTYTLKSVFGSCSSSDQMKLTVNPYPSISVSSDVNICIGDTASISVSGATNYEWKPNSFIDDATSPNPQVFPKTSTRYDVYADDGNSCITMDSVNVVVQPLAKTNTIEDSKICEGDKITLFTSGATSYKWIKNTSNLSATDIANPEASPKATTMYYVEGTNGFCPVIDSVEIQVVPKFTVNAGDDQSTCTGDTVFLTGESGFFYYNWSPAAIVNNPNIADPHILDLTANTTLTLRVEDENKCSATDEIDLTVFALPELNIGKDTFVCVEDNIDIVVESATGVEPFTFKWSPGFGLNSDVNSRDINIQGVKDTILLYTLEIEDANNCKNSDDILITMLEGLEIETFGDTTICNGSSVEIGVKGGLLHEWEGENIIGNSKKRRIRVAPDKPTSYTIHASNGEECGDKTGFVEVIVVQKPIIYAHKTESTLAQDTAFICKGRYIDISASGAEEYVWNIGDTTKDISYRLVTNERLLTVFGISEGCVGETDSILLMIDPHDSCASKIFVPTAFTPNDDGLNDQFEVHPFLIRNFSMSIFSRWGQLIYETDDPYEWWDGTIEGEIVPNDVYYYVIDAFGKDEESRSTNGTVVVIY